LLVVSAGYYEPAARLSNRRNGTDYWSMILSENRCPLFRIML
jgi:hypothetical protein